MNISVQTPTPAQIALESLAVGVRGQTASSQGVTPSATPGDSATQSSPAALLDVSSAGGAASDPADALAGAASIADQATAAGGLIEGLLSQMRQAAVSASDPSLGADARASLNASFQSDLAGIQSAVGQAGADGVNLIDGSVSGSLQTPLGGDATATLTATNLTATGPVIGLSAGANLLDPTSAADAAGVLGAAIGAVGQAVGQIASQGQAIQDHLDVMTQAWSSASGFGLDAAMGQDGARLQALQVQQQLAAGGYAVSGQAQQGILALFR